MNVKHTLKFKNLNCYDCAGKIKNEILRKSFVSNVNIDIVNQKMTLEFKDNSNVEEKIQEIIKTSIELEEEMSFINSNNAIGEKKSLKEIYILSIGILLFVSTFLIENINLKLLICLLDYILIGKNVIRKSFSSFKNGRFFDENTLMTVATVGAILIGEFQEAVAVMLFSKAGELIQDKAINKSRTSITKLMDIKPEIANVEINNSVKTLHPSDVKIGDIIIVKPGERIPLDGKIIMGESFIDTKTLTGEFLPKEVKKDDIVLSGCINIDSLIKIQVTCEFKDSTVSKILDLVENATSKKSNTENFITKFSKIYTPIVVFISLFVAVIPPLFINGQNFSTWIYRALIFLVISCPCALVISIPLSFFSGIGIASKNGILIKGSNYLDSLTKVSTVVFDKTGTLTEGKFSVVKINPVNCTKEYLLEIASLAESFSNHPIAKSVVEHYGKKIDNSKIKSYEEIPGHGIVILINSNTVIAGNEKLMKKFNIDFNVNNSEIGTKIYISENNNYKGYILVSDKIKDTSNKTIIKLKKHGINTIMLTGDNNQTGEKISKELNISNFYAELLPHEKVKYVENFLNKKKNKSNLVFVGDGINDAPSLAIADIGISMGNLGSDAAIEASDVVIVDDDPYKIVKAMEISKTTKNTAIANIIISLGVKIIVLLLGILGLSSIWVAILSDVGISLIVILNSVNILNKKF